MNPREQLTEKMTDEFNSFRDWLLTQSPEEILNHAREYTVKQDIVLNVDCADLSSTQAETLMRSQHPLEDVFNDYKQLDGHSALGWDCADLISQRAEDEMERQRAIPIYTGTLAEARERDELDNFKASATADENCKTAIESAIARNYDGSRLNTGAAIREVREQFGDKRMARVTASLIVNRRFEGRISPENRDWAEKKATSKEIGTGHTHPGLLDIFASRLRERERKRERGAER